MIDLFATWYYRLKVPLFEWKEQRWVAKNFYHDKAFKALDQELLAGPNPYLLAKVFPYGETPLRALYQIAQMVDLKPSDHFVDLGCGRGRALFFLSHFFGCRAMGIDLTPSFIHKARRLGKDNGKLTFICDDFLSYDFKDATCVYLYGTTYSEECLMLLREKLKRLPKGSRVISVSEELLRLHVHAKASVKFVWGEGNVFLQKTSFETSFA